MAGKYDPVNPVAYGAPESCPNEIDGPLVLSAMVGENQQLITEVRRMWIAPDDVVMDVTYGPGAFWGAPPVGEVPQIRHDIAHDGVDCRNLPEDDQSVDVVVFDPPYRAMHGGTIGTIYKGYRLADSGIDSITDVLDLYERGIKEAARVVRPGGRILVKCADLSYNSRLHLVHLDVLRSMVSAGFELADMFVLVNDQRIAHNEKFQNQKRARRNHSYLLVGAMPNEPDTSALPGMLEKLVNRFGPAAVERSINAMFKDEIVIDSLPAPKVSLTRVPTEGGHWVLRVSP